MRSKIFVITGLPATGKTTIGTALADFLGIPFFSKDSIKERIFDGLGYSDRGFSKKVGFTAITLMNHFCQELAKSGQSFIMESNFKPQLDNDFFLKISQNFSPSFVQILCHAQGDILFERFCQRATSGERHPGHVDSDSLEEFRPILSLGRCDPLDLPGPLIEVDTTDFAQIDFKEMLAGIKKAGDEIWSPEIK